MTWAVPSILVGSLRRLLLASLLGGLAFVAALLCGAQVLAVASRLAFAQDATLVRALDRVAAGGLPDMGATHRISAPDGAWLAGNAALPACPWPAQLVRGAGADRYVGYSDGALVRMAAALRPASGIAGLDAKPQPNAEVVVQVALPLIQRWPTAADVLDERLRDQLSLLAVVAVLCAAVAQGASLWMQRLARAFVRLPVEATLQALPAVPGELAPLVLSAHSAVQGNRSWMEQQRAFLADASHQLRTPLAVLRAQLQGLQHTSVPSADTIPAMLQTVDRATFVANQLLGLQRLDQARAQGVQPSPVAMWAVCRDAAMEIAPLVVAKRLDFCLDAFDFTVLGDATLLGEMVRNLMANAIHHAPAGGRMGVALRSSGSRRDLIVWDDGPGIDDALGSRLFHPFAAGAGGTGLGLSICKQIAEASGAGIALFNRVDSGQVVGVDAVVSWSQGP